MMIQFVPFPLIFGLLLLTVFEVILYWRKSTSIYYRFFFALFWAYLLLLASFTLFPIPINAFSAAPYPRQSAAYILSRVNLIPFDYSQFKGLDPAFILTRQVIENILLTMPFGFLINFITRSKIRRVPLLALVVGIGIELTQLVLCLLTGVKYRGIDINDALMNMIGVLGGYGCFYLFARWVLGFAEHHPFVRTGLYKYVYSIRPI